MFQRITVLFSFVFAIAMTHVLSCASKLILARDRVRLSGLHALWMLNALMLLLIMTPWSTSGNHPHKLYGDRIGCRYSSLASGALALQQLVYQKSI